MPSSLLLTVAAALTLGVAPVSGQVAGGVDCAPALTVNFPPQPPDGDRMSFIDGCFVQINGEAVIEPGCPALDRIQLDWGDGTVVDDVFPASHTYTLDPGIPTVTVTAFDTDGNSDSASDAVNLWDCLSNGDCGFPDQRDLRQTSFFTLEEIQACTSISLGPETLISGNGGDVTLEAGERVVFNGGVTVETGAFLEAGITPPVLADCTIEFDDSCPDATPECGATFTGGQSCVVDGLAMCYNSGLTSYAVDPGDVLTISLDGELLSLSVFFASAGSGQGEMTFFDADGVEVDEPLLTNGNCSDSMPPTQFLGFSRAVRRIEVQALGADRVYIDSFHVNPGV